MLPVKAMLVMLQVSLENLGAVVLLLIVVGIGLGVWDVAYVVV